MKRNIENKSMQNERNTGPGLVFLLGTDHNNPRPGQARGLKVKGLRQLVHHE